MTTKIVVGEVEIKLKAVLEVNATADRILSNHLLKLFSLIGMMFSNFVRLNSEGPTARKVITNEVV